MYVRTFQAQREFLFANLKKISCIAAYYNNLDDFLKENVNIGSKRCLFSWSSSLKFSDW